MKLNTVAELISDIRNGRMIVLMDDEHRENEGDLVMAASAVTPEDINFMARYARGLICLTLTEERCKKLNLKMMVENNSSMLGTNFTVSVDAARGVSTGISAADRAHTIRTAVSPGAVPSDIVQPGHILPLRAVPGGVLTRAGHTEAGCDLTRLAGLEPAAVIVEIMHDDGSMARRGDLERFATLHGLKLGCIADLVEHRILNERTIEAGRSGTVATRWGEFRLFSFYDNLFGNRHIALVMGDISRDKPVPVRVHVPDVVRDVLGIVPQPGSGWTVPRCLSYIAGQGSGILVLLGRPATAPEVDYSLARLLQQEPSETPMVQNMSMMIGLGAQILRDLGVVEMELMAQPAGYVVSGYGLHVARYLRYGDKQQ